MGQKGLTEHARVRMQQRGIPANVLEHLHRFGRAIHDHRGAQILTFDHGSRKRMQRELGQDRYRRLERHIHAYAVIDTDGTVITVGHRFRRVHH